MKQKSLSLMSLLVVSMIAFTISSCDSPPADNEREDIIYAKYYGNKKIKYLGEHGEYVVIPMFATIPTVNDSSVEFKRYHVIFKNDDRFIKFHDIAQRNIDNYNVSGVHMALTMYEDLYTPLSGSQDRCSIVKIASSESQDVGILAVRGVAGKGSGYYKTKIIYKNGKLGYVVIKNAHPIVGDYYIYDDGGKLYKNMPIAIKID